MAKKYLDEVNPELAKEWSEKNEPLTPGNITYGSNKKVWWKGKCEHEWLMSVKSRSHGEGCPYCAGKRILIGFNNLATKVLHLAEEWSAKNNELTPRQFTVGSFKKVWWKCHVCGYEWKALISTRGRGSKCECCSGEITVSGINDLETTQPELVKEWSLFNENIKPTEIRENSRELVWWTCRKCQHSWKASIATRVQGSGCPKCRQEIQKQKAIFQYKFSRDMARLEKNMEMEALRYYLQTAQIEAEFGNKDVIGVPIDIYIPSVHGAIFFSKNYHNNHHGYRMERAKNELCRKNNIRVVRIIENGFREFDNCAVITRMDDTLEAYDRAVEMALSMFGIKIDIDTERDMRNIFISFQKYQNERED